MAFAIAGGHPVAKGTIPFIVSVKSTLQGDHCGGSVIAPEWVLTAGHCLSGPWAHLGAKVAIGEDRSETIDVETIYVHPKYAQSRDYSYDFALLHLARATKAPTVKLLANALPVPRNDETHAPRATVAGWGATADGSAAKSKVLLATSVPLVSQDRCSDVYGSRIDDSMICAGFEAGGADSCDGDSGGPLFVQGPVLVGIVSDGDGCARPHKPGFYGRVEMARPWIRQVTGVSL